MNAYWHARIYRLYTSLIGRVFRFLFFFFIATGVFIDVQDNVISQPLLSFILLFLMNEIFFKYKIAVTSSFTPITNLNEKNIYDTLTLDLLHLAVSSKNGRELVRKIITTHQGKFLLSLMVIEEKEIPEIAVPLTDLLRFSGELAKKANGTYITLGDVILSYLQLIEPQAKLLFTKELKTEDCISLAQWVRIRFPQEEFPALRRAQLYGNGLGEWLVTGWTIETKKYTNNITSRALGKPRLILGREKEYQLIKESLLKKENNNILLVGERGAGKDNLVEAFAYDSFMGILPMLLNHKRMYELLVGALLAGATESNNLQERLQTVITEIAHAPQMVLYIPEFQHVVGSSSFHFDMSGVLFPYLRDGKLPIIATLTQGEYKRYFENNPLKEVFNVVEVKEPDTTQALNMLFAKTLEIEKKQEIVLTYNAVKTAISLADRYVQDKVLPGSAVTLLEDASHSVSLAKRKFVLAKDIETTISQKTHVSIGTPKQEEKELLLHLEDKLHERVIDQQEGITAIAESMRRLRAGLTSGAKPISFLFLGPTGVGKTETAKALSFYYFGSENNMLRFDMSEYASEDGMKRLLGALPGEGEERGELTDKVFDNPFSLILLDEFEKAHPSILNLFLQVLDDGRMTDNKGRTVSFRDTIIIATSNAASEFIREQVTKGVVIDKTFHQQLLAYLQEKNLFKPELLNRFDNVVTFKPLQEPEMKLITKMLIAQVTKKLYEQDITIAFDDGCITKIVKEGFDPQFGARPLKRYIQDNLEDILAKKILAGEIKRGNTVSVVASGNGFEFTVQ